MAPKRVAATLNLDRLSAAPETSACGVTVPPDTSSVDTHHLLTQAGIAFARILSGGSIAMLWYAWVFLVIAIIAAVFGFGGIAAGAASIAKILFFIFLVVFVISLIAGRRRVI
jgi:uncharacterized membrane protein YtjA (UPF0391 family)